MLKDTLIRFFKKLGEMLFHSGKVIIRKQIMTELIPLIQKEVDAGAIDDHVDAAIRIAIEKFCDKHLK